MAKTKQQLLARIYDDPKNYPYGFRRSGDFSIRESDALAQYGHLFNALYKGELQASDESDEQIIAVMQGLREPQTIAEKAWLKYQALLKRPKLGSLYVNINNSLNDDDVELEMVDDSDIPDGLEREED